MLAKNLTSIAEDPSKGNPIITHEERAGRKISKHDLGRFLVTSLSQDEHIGHICGITDRE